MTIATIIKDAREKASLSQRQVAISAKITPSTLSYIEVGKRTPTKQVARRLAKVLAIPEQDLLKYCNREKHAIGEGKLLYIALRYLPIVEKLIKVRSEDLSHIDQLLDDLLEE